MFLFITVVISGCTSDQSIKENISTLADIETNSIDKVSIMNCMSGESRTIDDGATIEELMSDLDAHSLEEKLEEEPLYGYRYLMEIYDDSGRIVRISIVDSGLIQVDGVFYDVVGSPINVTGIDELIDAASESISNNEGLNVGVSGSMEFLSIEELTSQSDIIITGTVTGAYPSRWNTPDGQRPDKSDDELDIGVEDMIYTEFGVHVNKYLKNPLDTGDLQITVAGGTVGNDFIWVEDNPSFEYGENILLFLNWYIGDDPEFTIKGGYQGKFTMINDETAARDDGVSVIITEFYDHWTITEI